MPNTSALARLSKDPRLFPENIRNRHMEIHADDFGAGVVVREMSVRNMADFSRQAHVIVKAVSQVGHRAELNDGSQPVHIARVKKTDIFAFR